MVEKQEPGRSESTSPYEVVKRISPAVYKITISKSKETVYHINKMKEWFIRDSETELSEYKFEFFRCWQVQQWRWV